MACYHGDEDLKQKASETERSRARRVQSESTGVKNTGEDRGQKSRGTNVNWESKGRGDWGQAGVKSQRSGSKGNFVWGQVRVSGRGQKIREGQLGHEPRCLGSFLALRG